MYIYFFKVLFGRMRLFSVLAALFATLVSVNAHGNGVDTCEITPGHGTWAQGCNPTNCFAAGGTMLPPYVIEVSENNRIINNYVPNTQYSIILRSTNTSIGPCNPSTCFKGFVMNVGTGRINGNFATVSANANITSGTLNLDPADTNVRRMSSCNNGLTHTSNTNKRSVNVIWNSPSSGSGPVTFKSIIVTSRTTSNYVATLILNERPTPSPSPTPSALKSIYATFYATSDCSGTPSLTNIAMNQNMCIGDASGTSANKYICSGDNSVSILTYNDAQCMMLSTNISYIYGACAPYSNGVYAILSCISMATPSGTPNVTRTPTTSRTMRASRTSSSTSSNTQSNTASITIGAQASISSSESYSNSITPSISVSNTQTSSNSRSVLPTPSNTDTPLETDTSTPSYTPNILPSSSSTQSNLPSYSSSPSHSSTSSPSNTQSHTGSYTSEPSNSLGSSRTRTPIPSSSEIVSDSQTASYSPTFGSSPSATETNNPDFITIITTSEQSQEQRLSNIGSGAAIGVIATIIIIGAFYVFHKRNMKRSKAVSMRNVVYMREVQEHISHNPTFAATSSGVQDAVPVRMPNYRKNSLEVTRNKFEPVGINH